MTRLLPHLHNPFSRQTRPETPSSEAEKAGSRPRTHLKEVFSSEITDQKSPYCIEGPRDADATYAPAKVANDLIQWEKDLGDIDYEKLAYLKALEWERSHYDQIEPADRILQNVPQEEYHNHVIRAEAEIVGADPDAVMECFKQAGLGAKHRQRGNVVTTANGVIAGAANMAPDIHTKMGLYAARIPLTLLNTYLNVSAADQKMWMDAWRELATLVRIDPPGIKGKDAPTPTRATYSALTELWDWDETLKKIQSAHGEFEKAKAALEANPHDPALQTQYEQAKRALVLPFAKLSHQIMVRMDYKTYTEGLKIDFFGNKRAFMHGYGSTWLLTLAAWGLLLSPAIGSTPPGAAMVGLAVLAQGLQLIYQHGDGPSKDGEDKERRTYIFLAKSRQLLMETCAERYKEIDKAYLEYERGMSRLAISPLANGTRQAKQKEIEDAFYNEMDRIISAPVDHIGTTSYENWKSCREHVREKERLASSTTLTPEEIGNQTRELGTAFAEAQKKNFNTKTINSSYRSAPGERRQKGERLLLGKLSVRLREGIKLYASDKASAQPDNLRTQRKKKVVHNQVVDSLFDSFNQELAKQRIKQASAQGTSPETEAACTQSATACLDAIRDQDVWDLFCGDPTAQANAGAKSKALTAGERMGRRIAYLASTAVTSSVSFILAGIGEARLDAAAHGEHVPRYNDQNFSSFAALVTGNSQQVTTYRRGYFNERELGSAQQMLETPGEAPHTAKLSIPGVPGLEHIAFFDRDNPVHQRLMADIADQLLAMEHVPESISIGAPATEDDGTQSTKPLLSLDLKKTSGLFRDRLAKASLWKKTRFGGAMAGETLASTANTIFAVPLQLPTKIPMRLTRHKNPVGGEQEDNFATLPAEDVQKKTFTTLHSASIEETFRKLESALDDFLDLFDDPASGQFAASLEDHFYELSLTGDAFPPTKPQTTPAESVAAPAFDVSDFGVAKRGMRGPDSVLHALVGKPLSPPAASAMASELIDAIRNEPDNEESSRLNARELASELARLSETGSEETKKAIDRIAELISGKSISNQVIADFAATPDAQYGRREIAAWSRLAGKMAVVVDSTDNTITAYRDGRETTLIKRQYDEALQNGSITANDVVLWKTADQWQQVDIAAKLGAIKTTVDNDTLSSDLEQAPITVTSTTTVDTSTPPPGTTLPTPPQIPLRPVRKKAVDNNDARSPDPKQAPVLSTSTTVGTSTQASTWNIPAIVVTPPRPVRKSTVLQTPPPIPQRLTTRNPAKDVANNALSLDWKQQAITPPSVGTAVNASTQASTLNIPSIVVTPPRPVRKSAVLQTPPPIPQRLTTRNPAKDVTNNALSLDQKQQAITPPVGTAVNTSTQPPTLNIPSIVVTPPRPVRKSNAQPSTVLQTPPQIPQRPTRRPTKPATSVNKAPIAPPPLPPRVTTTANQLGAQNTAPAIPPRPPMGWARLEMEKQHRLNFFEEALTSFFPAPLAGSATEKFAESLRADFLQQMSENIHSLTPLAELEQPELINIYATTAPDTRPKTAATKKASAPPKVNFNKSDFGTAKPGNGGGDCLFGALAGRTLLPSEISAMRKQLANVIRNQPGSQGGDNLNAQELALALAQTYPAQSGEIARLLQGRSISNQVYAGLSEISGIYAGRREIQAWSLLPQNVNRRAFVVDSSGNTITAYAAGTEQRLSKDAYDKALKNGTITQNDIVLWKTPGHWEQLDISGKRKGA